MIQTDSPSRAPAGACLHCGQSLDHSQAAYCCPGCEGAARLIHDLGLDAFYGMAEATTGLRVGEDGDFALLDAPAYRARMGRRDAQGRLSFTVGLRGLRCYACAWLIERAVAARHPGVVASVNMAGARVTVTWPREAGDADARLSDVAATIHALGYAVTPFPAAAPGARRGGGELIRLGVSLFVMGNVMMLAVGEYLAGDGGMEPTWRAVFRGASLALASVSVTYGAMPLYRASWAGWRQRRANVDLPLAVAIVATYVTSAWHVLTGRGPVYFDSLAALVGLILLGRFVHAMALDKARAAMGPLRDVSQAFVRRTARAGDDAAPSATQPGDGAGRGDAEDLVPLHDVRAGDVLRFLPGELIPLRGHVRGAPAEVSLAPITGEPEALFVREGDEVRGGAQNGALPLRLVAAEAGDECALWRAQSWLESLLADKGRFVRRSETLAGVFAAIVFTAAALVLLVLWWQGDATEGARRAVATLLIACPCVLALGGPLVFARACHLALARGVVFRRQQAIEALGEARAFHFDKTGTLTRGETAVESVRWDDGNLARSGVTRAEAGRVIAGLDALSTHHAARALAAWARREFPGGDAVAVDAPVDAREDMGQGVSFTWRGRAWRVGRAAYCGATADGDCHVSVAGRLVASFAVTDPLRGDAAPTLAALRDRGITTSLVSGDRRGRVAEAGDRLGIPAERLVSQATPEGKLGVVTERHGRDAVVMVGNGWNDALALAKAAVGVAVADSPEAVKETADVVLTQAGVAPLVAAVDVARGARRALARVAVFALAYNAVGLACAALGGLSPLVAAVMMPASSLCVLALATTWGPQEEEVTHGRLVPAPAP